MHYLFQSQFILPYPLSYPSLLISGPKQSSEHAKSALGIIIDAITALYSINDKTCLNNYAMKKAHKY